ncbi:hypothetical protein NF556_12450 [Ornithinimicrobium faecis]|uniref:Polyketide cyclase / dehydrase and lipid transport n=1 Tax=Ornithinimicrobium faecis TaxID=2934158 RepID=A0ABY4YP32_9MICO|nr:hypothetical protein [Ornithinimicrobium sp. HY1793]USQ78449.1 hypothetical protein NF556_12450 [Ornithinimicrobium sp. HY1793]
MWNLTRPADFPWTRPHPVWPQAIRNEHSQTMAGDTSTAQSLMATLGGPDDLIWPRDRFPAMELDRGHEIGSKGGHGSVRYRVVEATDSLVRFEVDPNSDLVGGHVLWFEDSGDGLLRWTHQLDLELTVPAPAMRLILALHDAIIEQLLVNAEARLAGREPSTRRLSPTLGAIRPAYVAAERVISRRRGGARGVTRPRVQIRS